MSQDHPDTPEWVIKYRDTWWYGAIFLAIMYTLLGLLGYGLVRLTISIAETIGAMIAN